MKKINNAHGRFLRRLVKRLFTSWIKRQSHKYSDEFEKVLDKLQEIDDSIEIIAREIVRQSKRWK